MVRPEAAARALLVLLSLAAPLAAATPDPFAECAAAVWASSGSVDAYRCYWVQSRQNRAAEARRHLERILAAEPANYAARLYLARIHGDQGHDEAEPLYARAIAGFTALGDRRGEVFARLGLVLLLGRRGRSAEADRELAAASRAAEAAGDRELQAWVRAEQGWQAFRAGDFGNAGRLFKELEREVFPDGAPALRAQCLSGLGGVSQETGRFAEAFEYTRRQADLCHQAGDFYDEARARGNLVLGAFRLSLTGEMERDEIVALARSALRAARAGGNRGTEARAELYLGDLTTGLEAREHYRRGLAISRETREIAGLILGLRGGALSLVETAPREPAEARRLADAAVELARGSPFYSAIARLARARVAALVDSREAALAAALDALDAVEAIRDLQSDELVRARVFGLWTFAYHRAAGYLLTQPRVPPADLALAFAIGERMRARVLLDELDAARASTVAAPAAELKQRRAALLEQIGAAQRTLLRLGLPDEQRRRALAELERLELAEQRVRADYARAHPDYAALRQPRLATLGEVQEALAPDQGLLAFEVAGRYDVDNRTTERGSWLWAVTREGVRFYPIPDREGLEPLVSPYLGLLQRRDGAEVTGAVRLHQALLAPALRELPPDVRRLVIVPDSLLHRLPFTTLRAEPAAEPVAARYEVAVAPSATLWLRFQREVGPVGAAPVLALADPSLPDGAGAPAGEGSGPAARPGPGWEPLPHARLEAQDVVRRLGGASRILLGHEASEAFLKRSALRRFAVLHFATHALVDESHPERSAILLAPGAPGEDGLLQIRDVVGLDLGGSAVVLSACRTAGGELLEGEGVMGLARGFFQAGVPTVVGSLWPLRDDDGARLFGAFYRHLAEGKSAAGALAAAQRERLASGAPAAAWAGVVVLGNGDFVPFPGRVRRVPAGLWTGLAAAATGAAAALLVFRRSRRKR